MPYEKTIGYLVRRMVHKSVIRLFIRGSTMLEGSFGSAKKPNVAYTKKKKKTEPLGKGFNYSYDHFQELEAITFMTRFLVSMGSLGSIETNVVQADRARLCKRIRR
jgi:hypothetical protein